MKAYIQSKKTMILSLSIIAFLFLSAVVIALLFNDVTPAAMLGVLRRTHLVLQKNGPVIHTFHRVFHTFAQTFNYTSRIKQ